MAASGQSMGLVATGGGDDSAFLWRIGQVEEEPIQLKGESPLWRSLILCLARVFARWTRFPCTNPPLFSKASDPKGHVEGVSI